MAEVAPAGADHPVTRRTHRIGSETRCRIGVARGAALSPRHRDVRRAQAGRRAAVVADRTIRVGRRMGVCRTQPRRGALVTALARIGGGNMIGRLAECGGAVVATGARSRDAGVIHHRRAGEAHRAPVAVGAGSGRNDMIGRLAESECAVVTACARRHGLGMVDETHVAPRRREMAALALIGGLRVRLRLAGRFHAVVAGETLGRRAFEAPIGVTGGAVDAGMRTGKRKSGRKMIERCGQSGLCVAGWRKQQHRHCEQPQQQTQRSPGDHCHLFPCHSQPSHPQGAALPSENSTFDQAPMALVAAAKAERDSYGKRRRAFPPLLCRNFGSSF